MFKTWFKIFYRNSKKNWLNIVVNIFGLTVGFAGLLLVLLYLPKAEIESLFDSWDPDKSGVLELDELQKQLRRGGKP